MPKVFISYRRADPAPNFAVRHVGRMCRDNGFDEVFVDRNKGAIPFGSNYRMEIEKAIHASDVTLVLIGEKWQVLLDEKRQDPNDMVQIEIGLSLELGKLVVPVLLGGRMPAVNELPERLQPFHFCNGRGFDPDTIEEQMPTMLREVITGLERQKVEALGKLLARVDEKIEARRREEQRETEEAASKREQERRRVQESARTLEQSTISPAMPFTVPLVAPTIQKVASRPVLPREEVVDLGRGVKMAFCFVPAGSFVREGGGTVTLTKDFWLGKYPLTQGEWMAVMGSNPSRFKVAGERAPVELVSWNDAQVFLKKLGNGFRLPTEAEWEYACRAGSTTDYCFGDDEGKLGDYAWFDENSGETTHPVGEKKPNDWGLHDMHGNVYEWCQDWYGDYPKGAVTDPIGPSSGGDRVLRGGCWGTHAGDCRSANRSGFDPYIRIFPQGFRVLAVSVPSSPGSR